MADTFHILEWTDSYFHGVLKPEEKRYVEQHCEKCAICKTALDAAKNREQLLAAQPGRDVPPVLVQNTLTKIATHDRTHGRRMRILRRAIGGGLAAAVLILAALHLYFANLAPSPYDLRIFGQSKLFAGSNASLRVQLLDHARNIALANVPVTIELFRGQQHVELASFVTDALGTFPARFRLPDWQSGDCELRVTARPHGEEHVIRKTIKLQRSWKVMLSSDRPVYQPGQTIQVRAITLRATDLKPVAGQNAVFSISDPKGNIIFKQKDVTSKFGICAAECPLASEIIEGTYILQCQLEDTNSQLAVEVKKYVLPRFKIDLTTDQPFYQPGQRIRGTVRAAYFFGKPVTDGVVELVLQSRDEKPLLRQERKLTLDSEGNAKFEFAPLPDTLIGREQDAGAARIDLDATVTDTAGQKQTRRLSQLVSAESLRIEVIPEAGTLVQGLANTIYLFVSSADGRPVKARVQVSGIEKELTTSELGVTSYETTPTTAEIAQIIRATDDQGRSVRREVHLQCGQAEQDFLVRCDKAVYRSGDTMRLTAHGGGIQPVFVDLIKDGQTMLTQTIDMKDGRGQLTIDLPADLFGTLQMCAYRFSDSGLPVRKTRVFYVDAAADLKIETTLDQPEYRPGENARIQFRLTDKDGKPTAGALSLAAVDEAVFSVLDEMPGLERMFHGLQSELMKPVYAIYPAWGTTARDERGPENTLLEKAAFAKTSVQGTVSSRKGLLRSLLPFMENSESALRRIEDTLDRPDWEQLVYQGLIPDEVLALLRNESGTHPLQGASYPVNVRQTEVTRRWAMELFRNLWCVFGVVFGTTGFVAALMIIVGPRPFDVLKRICIIGLILLVLVIFLVPATQKVRESSARMSAMNDLRSVAVAVDAMREADPSRLTTLLDQKDLAPNGQSGAPRLREYFPETLLWRPELITDDQGRASLALDLADSITTWRLTSSAVTTQGKLGAARNDIKVFQPFFVDVNLPVALTRGDEVAVPIVLYNYLDKPQQVKLEVAAARWFTSLDQASQTAELRPHEVRSLRYRIRVTQPGWHDLQVTALGSGVSDAIKRRVEVVPDGQRVEHVWNGNVGQAFQPAGSEKQTAMSAPQSINLELPANAIEGSPRLFVKIYPSSFSQLVEGLDAIFQLPYGCFEQTSSTTYPNVLALDYLKRSGKSVPAVEAKARQYIHLGYQRLLGFEVAGGGFDWFGRPPANRTLTAYGLMEFSDMARVHDVDPRLIERTRKWLLEQRQPDGSWNPEGHTIHGLPTARLSATAYIAWAVFRGQNTDAGPTRTFLLQHAANAINDPHTLALVCNALLAIDPTGQAATPYLEQLDILKQSSENRKMVWWEQTGRTTFYGAGQSGSIETTALATLAFLQARHNPAGTNAALRWITEQRDAGGAWHSTQATVLALKALLSAADNPAGEGERRIELAINGVVRQINIPEDQAEVMKQLDLSEHLKPGQQMLTLSQKTAASATCQVTLRYHVPAEPEKRSEPLSIRIDYDRNEMEVGILLQATARIANNMKEAAPMVLIDLPIPAGFAAQAADFDKLVADNRIAKYQMNARSVLVYLRDLPANGSLELRYGFRALMPVQVRVPAARVYEYYNPAKEGFSATASLRVRE